MKEKELSNNLHAFNFLYRQIVDKKLEEKGIYYGQPPILKYLSLHPNATQKDIADCLKVSQASIATSVKRMERSELIKRTADKNDARRNNLNLTDKGLEMEKIAEEIMSQTDREIFGDMKEKDIEEALTLIQKINSNTVRTAGSYGLSIKRRDENA
ncbi:MAG: MarR family winged helix-turn-helix transcriptional regulator [Clostridiales bacterium]|nr:MarR family winged helix-turn-helix transcriptional regulator [Clostridiales bacterium]